MAVTITNDAGTTRTNLGLGDAATKTVGTASGNIPVLDSAGKLASGRMPTLKTVGGSSIIGSGDISTLPSGGTANQVLTSDASSNATWADAAGGGKVLQMKYMYQNSTWSTQNTSYVDTSWSVTINTISSTSTIVVEMDCGVYYANSGGGGGQIFAKLVRNGSNITGTNTNGCSEIGRASSTGEHNTINLVAFDVAHPAVGTSVTYKLQVRSNNGANVQLNDTSSTSSLKIMEIEV